MRSVRTKERPGTCTVVRGRHAKRVDSSEEDFTRGRCRTCRRNELKKSKRRQVGEISLCGEGKVGREEEGTT